MTNDFGSDSIGLSRYFFRFDHELICNMEGRLLKRFQGLNNVVEADPIWWVHYLFHRVGYTNVMTRKSLLRIPPLL